MLMKDVFAILDSVEVPMRDGTVLRADVWLPGGDGQWPILLQRTPYRRESSFGTEHVSSLDFRTALRRGYAIVIQDTRGRFGSDGDFDPFETEASDGYDTIAWLTRQKFSNGQVAMFGASYPGATQVLAAMADPPGLLAIAPQLTTARYGETWLYRGGAIELGFLLVWLFESLAPVDLPRRQLSMSPEHQEVAYRLLMKLHANPREAFARLPLLDNDLEILAPYAKAWFDNSRASAAHSDRQALDALTRSRPAILAIGGWNDIFIEGTIELFEAAQRARSEGEVSSDRLIIGPWSHGNPSDWQGDGWNGYGSSVFGLSEEQLAFFDAVFEERQPGSPAVRYFRSGSNTWHVSAEWPVPANRQALYLDDTALSSDADRSAKSWQRTYVSDTLSPVPTAGGATLLPGAGHGRNSGPKDQAAIESRSDVLIFTSPPLDQDLDVTGLVEAQLWVGSSAVECDWTVKLCEVDEQDRSLSLVDGVQRWRNPDPGGSQAEVRVRVGHVSHLFRKGRRLRVQIASSNFPRFDRNPQSGVPSTLAGPSDFASARQVVVGDPVHPSCILLPVVHAASAPATSLSSVSA